VKESAGEKKSPGWHRGLGKQVVKRRRHHSTSSAAHGNPKRGRPPKAEHKRVLQEGGRFIAQEFSRHPLRTPIDARFRPYYERILSGDLHAIDDYLHENKGRLDVDASFYELIGRLVPLAFSSVARQIVKGFQRRELLPTGRATYAFYFERLVPLCRLARQFVVREHRSESCSNREQLWQKYVFQPLPELDALQQELRREAIKILLEGQEVESPFLDSVNAFAAYGFVPKNVFKDIALTRIESGKRCFVSTPALLARRYACRIAGISEGTASHKSVGKTTD
jgi:hypothetical protein